MQWFTLAELTGIQDDPSKRQSAALCLATLHQDRGLGPTDSDDIFLNNCDITDNIGSVGPNPLMEG